MTTKAFISSPIIGRKREMLHLLRILFRENKNNVMLVGNSGIGKKTLVYELGQKISKHGLPFIDNVIFLDTHELIFQSLTGKDTFIISLKEQLEQCKQSVFFLPDIHALFQDDKDEIKKLYPIFSIFAKRKDLRLICSIDPVSYRNVIEKDVFLQRIFGVIRMEEMSEEMSAKVLIKVAQSRRFPIDTQIAEEIVRLAKRYIFSQFLPEKALDVLDEVLAKVIYEKRKTIVFDDIKEVIADKTGIPITSISATDQEKLIHLEDVLSKKVVGQPHAVSQVTEIIKRSRVGLKDPKRPIGSFLFIGGSGVGKTELAKSLAESIYDSEQSFLRLDMSEYTESHSLQRLIGAPPGYVGYEEGGQLTNPVWERPYSLLLLDEIEKAHAKVFDVFLQVLDEGRLTDGQGKTVNFNNTIIIATSNAGFAEIIDDLVTGVDVTDRKFIDKKLIPVLMQYFRLEFLNRFDDIIVFKPLTYTDLVAVTRIQIDNLKKRLKERHIQLEVSDDLIAKIAQSGQNPLFGARAIKRVIQQKIENTIAHKLLYGEVKEGGVIKW